MSIKQFFLNVDEKHINIMLKYSFNDEVAETDIDASEVNLVKELCALGFLYTNIYKKKTYYYGTPLYLQILNPIKPTDFK